MQIVMLFSDMRRLTLLVTFLILWGAVGVIWQHRYEKSPNSVIANMEYLKLHASFPPGVEWRGSGADARIRVRVDQAHSNVVTLIRLPRVDQPDFLHIRSRVSAVDLIPGKEVWDDGRCIIEWSGGEGVNSARDAFSSVRFNHRGELANLVLKPSKTLRTPVLRLENLGASGDLELSEFEAMAVRETLVWKIGGWLVAGAWTWWVSAWIGSFSRLGARRRLLAAGIWVMLGSQCVIPGPWHFIRPLGPAFEIGESHQTQVLPSQVLPTESAAEGSHPSISPPAPIQSAGKLPTRGGIAIQVKILAGQAKGSLHVLMILFPTLLTAILVGARPAAFLGALLSIAIEMAEIAFGYGFDRVDVLDLFFDFAGLGLALWIWQVLRKSPPSFLPAWSVRMLKTC